MRVLLLHNRYRAEGGEERAVADLARLLAERGHQVRVLERSSRAVGRARAAHALLRGGAMDGDVERTVKRLRADVVHAHNVHPLFGWRALATARAAGARTVLHLHNFRLFCAIGVAYRDGAPCFRCRGSNTLPGLRLRCRGSLGEAAVYAAALHRQQPRLYEHADRFVTVSQATADQLHALGLPSDRTAVLPNFVAAGEFAARSRAGEGAYALAVGRLVEEKGFDTAIEAARGAGVPLVIAGEGPDGDRLRALASGSDVRFTGRLDSDALVGVIAGAAVLLAPSRSDEACPYSVIDALAAGVPALVSDRGGLPELVLPSTPLPAQDLRAWSTALASLWRDRDLRRERGRQALASARARLHEDRYYEALLEVYTAG
jgi:glycosyltransferase involved in cell wall biosynthesis